MQKLLAYLGLGQAGAFLSFLNKIAAIIDKFMDEHLRNKYRAEGRAEVTAEANKSVYEQLDSARKNKEEMGNIAEEAIDAVLDEGLKR